MRLYKMTTRFLGADEASDYFYSTKEKAEADLRKQENGEINITDVIGLNEIPFEGCTWNDIEYWRNRI